MGSGLQWAFEILDKVSNPARGMDAALGGVEKQLKAVSEKLHQADMAVAKSRLTKMKDPLERQAAELRIQRAELAHLAGAHREAGEHAGGFFEKLRHGLETVYFGKEVLSSMAEKAREFGGEIVKSVGFKQRSMIGLEAMLGDRDKAKEVFESVEHAALATGTAVETVMERTKDLLSAGFGVDEIATIRRGIGDLGVAMGPEKAAALAEQIADIGRNGMMTGRQLLMLKHVLPMEDLRKQLGVTSDGMNKLLDGSKAIEAGKAVTAILKVIRDRFSDGILGSIAKKDAETLPKLIDRVRMIPEIMASALAGFDGHGTAGIEKVLSNIADAFNPEGETGQRILERARDLLERLGRAFGISGGQGGLFAELAGPNGAAKVEEIFNRVANAVESAIPKISSAASAVWKVVEAIAWLNDHADTKKIGHAIITQMPGVYDTSTPEGIAKFEAVQAEQDAAESRRRATRHWLKTGVRFDPEAPAPTASGDVGAGFRRGPAAPPPGFGPTTRTTTNQVNVGGMYFYGVKDAEDAHGRGVDTLSELFEQVGMQAGG